ncbi:MarR family transcriptional regulator [Ruminococcus sp. CLA-AA-H200]|uniref:MarR family transcriptional regulator n=1 Tax=Ruminococcus turbiniformis TaxID=2881258 RepID=A0ABS8FV32_9FIRM|nr:MarR family transcriptional regulator [Ruminococcus turbiniformis]MCC2253911.1 MarR family transcriptional regulator [Ruminococcus turbiniformis]
MNSELKEQFFTSIVHFRKLESALSSECEMQMNEMVILNSIAGTCCRECPCMNLDVPMMQKKLNISKPAISYILNTLEKKKYIVREIDPKDRRKVSISATPEGKAAAKHSMQKYDELLTALLTSFGEDNMRQLIQLIDVLDDLYESRNK